MLDLKFIRDNTDKVKDALKKRNSKITLDDFLVWDKSRRDLIAETDTLRAERKKLSEEFGKLKKSGQDAGHLSAKSDEVAKNLQEKQTKLEETEKLINDFVLQMPNIPDDTVPVGATAEENKVVRQTDKHNTLGTDKPKGHWELGEKLGILDFERAAKISSSRFALYKGKGAALERALFTFMLDTHTKEHGYTEIFGPYLVNSKSATGTGQLPKFAEEIYKCAEDDLYLIPTAEVSVTNMHRDEILNENELTIKYVSYSACFRREAGSYGKDTKGLIRNHQFNKVELVKFSKPENSMDELEKLTLNAEEILKKLKLQYRTVALSTGDLGFSSSKTYDLEVWMPGENLWREVSSCSNFKDFQARRMNIKFKRENGTKEYVHTLNGSGTAVGRIFAAILENYQQSDGSIVIPEILKKYLDFEKIN
ncbi:MAG: serine--tRNA ligase [Elusimicrobia bacterium RIFOXYA2_FULL_39_19]|nr:MAG: serine--tRNA ligase [Elusimicrobia bacterium RIFOXYA2_FULL_39_19]